MPSPNAADDRSGVTYHRRTWAGGLLLAAMAATLSFLAIRFAVPFSGLGALMATFLGSLWLTVRLLRSRWARFNGEPIGNPRRFW